MKQQILKITENIPLTDCVYRMALESPELEEQKPGQFVNIRLEGLYLRRPISVYDSEPGRLEVIYKTVGRGTEQMSRMKAGETLDVLTGLGNGYDLAKAGDAPLLLGCGVTVTTADGSYGTKGFVTDALPDTYSYFYTCGPEPMLKAVYKKTKTSGQFSFEERMGCGFGACMGCSCRTITGTKRICREGPVLEKEEILWED